MNYPDTAHFQFDSQGVDWQLLLRLFKATNMGGREGELDVLDPAWLRHGWVLHFNEMN